MRSARPPDTVRFRPLRSITRMRTLTLVVDPEPTTLVTLTNPADPLLLTEGLLTYDRAEPRNWPRIGQSAGTAPSVFHLRGLALRAISEFSIVGVGSIHQPSWEVGHD